MGRKNCIVCGSRLPERPLMCFEGMPASAQDIPDAEHVQADRGMTLRLCQCPACGLVQLDCEPVAYYRDVIRSGGYSTTMAELRTRQYRHLIETYHLQGKKFLEVGCGRGEFLSMLDGFEAEAYGTEHRRDLAEAARKAGLRVFDGFTETADTVLGDAGPYDVFLSFNFLEHQPQPGVMLDCIYRNLSEDGMGLVTVPSLEYILRYDGYYELIRDHIAYYTFASLRHLMELHGFTVLEEELINRDTLAVIVRKTGAVGEEAAAGLAVAAGEKTPAQTVAAMGENTSAQTVAAAEEEAAAGLVAAAGEKTPAQTAVPPVDLSAWTESRDRIRNQLLELTDGLRQQGGALAVWGASHQGFTLAATTCLGERAVYIIDSAPFKQGRFAPASHLPIVSPDYARAHPAAGILIAAPGYTEEIFRTIRSRFGEQMRVWTLRSETVEELR